MGDRRASASKTLAARKKKEEQEKARKAVLSAAKRDVENAKSAVGANERPAYRDGMKNANAGKTSDKTVKSPQSGKKIVGNTTRADAQTGGAARQTTNRNKAKETVVGNTTRSAVEKGGAARRTTNDNKAAQRAYERVLAAQLNTPLGQMANRSTSWSMLDQTKDIAQKVHWPQSAIDKMTEKQNTLHQQNVETAKPYDIYYDDASGTWRGGESYGEWKSAQIYNAPKAQTVQTDVLNKTREEAAKFEPVNPAQMTPAQKALHNLAKTMDTTQGASRAIESLTGHLPGRLGSGTESVLKGLAAWPYAFGETLDQSIADAKTNWNNDTIANLNAQAAQLQREMNVRGLPASVRQEKLAQYNQLRAQIDVLSAKNSVDMSLPGQVMMGEAGQASAQTLDGLSGWQRGLANAGMSIGQNLPNLALSAVAGPGVGLAMMAGQAGTQKMYELNARGISADESLARGLVSGGIEALTEKIPLENFLNVARTGGVGAVKNVLKQMGIEATEEGASYVMNWAADKAAHDPEATFSVQELANSMAGGALSGGIMGGAGTLLSLPGKFTRSTNNQTVTTNPNSDTIRAAIENAGGRVPAELMPTETGNNPEVRTMTQTPNYDVTGYTMSDAAVSLGNTLAQMDDPKATLNELKGLYQAAHDEAISRASDYVKSYQPQGVSILKTDDGRGYRASQNEDWYRRFYAQNGRAPRNADIPAIAEQLVTQDTTGQMFGFSALQKAKLDAMTELSERVFTRDGFTGFTQNQNGDVQALYDMTTDQVGKVRADASTGAAPLGFDPYTHASNEYGAIPPGEIPARTVDVPVSMDGETKTSRFTRTEMEASATPDEMIPLFERGVEEGFFSYNPRKNKQDLDSALNYIAQNGYERSLKAWNEKMESGGSVTADDMIRAQIMYAKAAQSGDTATAMKLAGQLAAEGTRLGQAVQSMRMLKRLTPEGKLVYIQRTVDNLNREFGNKLSGDQINLNENLVQEYMNAPDDATRSDAEARIYQNIADQVPSTWADKWNAWRYFAMLGNPRTHIRNILGNFMFYVPTKAKDFTGAALENLFIQKEKRTKSIGPVSKEISDFVKQDFAEMKDVLIGSDKYNPKQAILQRAKPWSDNNIAGRAMNSLTGMNSAALDAEDSVSLGIRYRDALGHYMKARGLKPADMTGHTLEVARNYAVQEAQKATFRDDSPVANALQNLENKNAATKLLVGGLVPFKKTPINIVKRGLEYSPAGFLKTGADAVRMVQQKSGKLESGTMTGTQIIDDLSKAFVGTGLMAAGFALAKSGLLNGADADEKKEQYLNDAAGLQSYSLNIGNYTYTVDWTAPASLPLFMGVELYNAMTGEKDGNALNAMISSLQNITEPVFNLTMLDGINNAIQSVSYGGNPISTAITDTVMDYVGQGVPTLFGQIARTIDDTRRSSSTPDKLTGIDTLDKFLRRQQAKIPGASQKLQPYLDVFGRETKNDSLPMRALQNLLSPGYIAERKDDGVEGHLMRLYGKTGDTDILPGKARSFKVDGEEAQMTGDEMTKYVQKAGQGSYYALNQMFQTSIYQNMSDSDKVKAIQGVYSYAKELAKEDSGKGYQLSSGASRTKSAVESGAPVGAYLALQALQKTVVSQAEDSNTPNPTDVGRRALLNAIQSDSTMSNEQKDAVAKGLVINAISDKQADKYAAIQDAVPALQYAASYAKYREIENDSSIASKDKNATYREWLKEQPYSAEVKNLIDANIVNDGFFMPKEVDVDYSSDESFYKSQASKGAQKKWGTLTGTYGISMEMAGTLYSACWSGKKAESVKTVMALTGWSKSKASEFYTVCRRR